ncbi:hypothetical protein DFQ04_0381 [Algoriphagus boseongensis]|uniref:Uncharacterized protein n=1 Tax=Algoriphagus boseongensis TaxID=1442587 RepID=A0A4R6T8M5_9BACT|nr:hypothetical protein DFQ04_0381 [Algoriphagus boseongensis]
MELEILKNDTVSINEDVLVRIYTSEKNWKIVKAYFDCNISFDQEKVDESKESIEGCQKELFVLNDTILIQFNPTKTGLNNFGEIKALVKNTENEFKILKSDFSYFVSKKID